MCVFMVSLNTFHLSPLDQAKIRLKPNLIFSILYIEKYLPLFYSRSFCPQCQRSNLTLGKFQCLIISLVKQNCVWVNSRWSKLLPSVKGQKLHRGKITMYTVVFGHCHYGLVSWWEWVQYTNLSIWGRSFDHMW